jgi:hypothetical protein
LVDSKGAERRRWPRAPVYGEIVGQIYTETAAPVLDLSEGGALLEVPCVLRPRSFYTLRLSLGSGAVMLLKASVVRSYVHHLEKFGDGESRVRYHAALQFIDITERDRVLLRLRIAGDASLAGAIGARLGPSEPEAARAAAGARTPDSDPLLAAAWPQGAPPPLDRRDSERLSLGGQVEGEVGLRLDSTVLMLSLGGMMVRMPFAPQLGSMVSCSLDVDGRPVRVEAIVRDASRESAEPERSSHVVGLEFLGLSAPARTQIEGYIARRLKSADGGDTPAS